MEKGHSTRHLDSISGGAGPFLFSKVLFDGANGLVWKLWAETVPLDDSGEINVGKIDN